MSSTDPTTGRRGRRAWLLTAAIVAVLAVGAASWYLLTQRDGTTPVASSTPTTTPEPSPKPEPSPTPSETPKSG